VLNREYHKRATRQGLAQRSPGPRHAPDANLGLPWAGIVEPWRPLLLIAAAADEQQNTAKRAAKRCKNSRQLKLFDGKLRGVQLALSFPDPVQNAPKSPADSDFPALADMVDPMAGVMTEDELAAEFEKLFT